MSQPTEIEQLTLELINRARLDPLGEFDRFIADASTQTAVQQNITDSIKFFNVDMALLRTQFNALTSADPLAWNDDLADSADIHSNLMIQYQRTGHQFPEEPSYPTIVSDRFDATGYSNTIASGENAFAAGQDALFTHAAFFIDWGGPASNGGIQLPAGHRDNIMSTNFTEIGISFVPENDPSTLTVGPNSVTHHLANSTDTDPQLLGVAFDDKDGNDFYGIGEGLRDLNVAIFDSKSTSTGNVQFNRYSTETWDAGGYQIELPDDTYNIVIYGTGVNGIIANTATISGSNLKLDGVAQKATATPQIHVGTSGDDVFTDDTTQEEGFFGGDGFDVVTMNTTRSAATVTADAYGDVEALQFTDGQLRLDEDSGAIYRLYRAGYNRTPDEDGLSFWTTVYDKGLNTIDQIADAFVSATEFTNIYGGLNDVQIIEGFYSNVLGRPADQAGLNFWVGIYQNPSNGFDLSDMIEFFADSDEGRALVEPEIENGIFINDNFLNI